MKLSHGALHTFLLAVVLFCGIGLLAALIAASTGVQGVWL